MKYHMTPLLESFFTEEKMREILTELQANPQGGPVWEAFWFIYRAKAYYEEEITDRFLTVQQAFFYQLIHLNRKDIMLKLLEVNSVGALYSAGFDDPCPLCYAICCNNIEMAKAMIDVLTPEEMDEIEGITPGYVAIDNGNTDLVRYLLNKGCKTKSFAGSYSALQCAVQRLKLEIVDVLLQEYHVDVNEMGEDWGGEYGYPPLTLAVKSDIVELVKMLLGQKGIDVDRTDKDGLCAVDYARSDAVRTLLMKAGAKETRPWAKMLCKAYVMLREDCEEEALDLTKELVKMPGASAVYQKIDLLKLAFSHDNTEIINLILKNGLVDFSNYKTNLLSNIFCFFEDETATVDEISNRMGLLKNLVEKGYRYPLAKSSKLYAIDRVHLRKVINILHPEKHEDLLMDLLLCLKTIGFDLG